MKRAISILTTVICVMACNKAEVLGGRPMPWNYSMKKWRNNGKPRKDFGIQINLVKFALPLTIFREFCQRRWKFSTVLCTYEHCNFPDGKALPVISNQLMDRYLKSLCELAGFNTPSLGPDTESANVSKKYSPSTRWLASAPAAAHSSASPSPAASRSSLSWNGPGTLTTRPWNLIFHELY